MSDVQVAVVGGGPAGLAAATAAARAGARAVLFDEGPDLGGQLCYRLPMPPLAEDDSFPVPPLVPLLAEARDAGVDLRPRSIVWGLLAEGRLSVAGESTSYQVAFDLLVVATGSTDLPLPFPGSSLPGVFSGRALQLLLNRHRVLPGRRVAVLGAGPEAAEVARDIRLGGGEVVVVNQADAPSAIRADGIDGVSNLTVGDRRHAVDVVAVAVGRQPDVALPLMAGRGMAFAPALGGWVPVLDERLRTDDPCILAAGDAAGVCEAGVALAEGRYAGVSAAVALGLADEVALGTARAAYQAAAPARIAALLSLAATYAQPDERDSA